MLIHFSFKYKKIMKVCPFFYYLIILIFLVEKIESGKLQKSFNEIFGEGWEERKQKAGTNLENGLGDQNDGIVQYQTRVIQQSDQNKKLDQINEEERTADQNENGHDNGDQTESGHENGDDQSRNDQQKREIIRKYYAIKEKIKQKAITFSRRERSKIECTIARKLGTCRNYIYKWKKEFEMGSRIFDESKKYGLIQKFIEMTNEYKRKRMHSRKEWAENYAEMSKKLGVCYGTIKRWKKEIGTGSKKIMDEEQTREIIRKFRAIKEKIKQKGKKYSTKEWHKFDKTIAHKLGTNQSYIYKWIKELGIGVKSKCNDIKKVEIIKQFNVMIKKYKRSGKYSRKEWQKSYDEIGKKLGVHWRTIHNWKKEFGMCEERKSYSNEERSETMEQYWEMKRTNPKISERRKNIENFRNEH